MTDTIWQADLDEKRLKNLKPYKAVPSTRTINDIYGEINHNMYLAYGPDYAIGGRQKLVIEPPQRYDDLLRELSDIAGMKMMTCADMLKTKPAKDEVFCNLRHDIDGDLRAALQQAKIEAKYGAKSTFYVLHTAYYFGTFTNHVHFRNNAPLHIYKEIQDLGHEIALHTDPMHLYQILGIDGGQALVDDMNWMRDHGLNITGTAAHNSVSVYGANNYTVFKKRPYALFYENENMGVIHHGKWAPLQMLDEQELGLEYEGNDVFWQSDVPVEYGCLMKHDGWYFEHDKHGQLLSTPVEKRGKVTGGWMDQNQVVDHARTMEKGKYLLLSVHPMFYGLRHNQSVAPTQRLCQTSSMVNTAIGWKTCVPRTLEAHFADHDGEQEFQSVSITNPLGMLDKPSPEVPVTGTEDEIRVLILGRDNLHGESICIPAQLPTRLENYFERIVKRPLRAFKMAAPGMGFTRYTTWMKSQLDEIKPHYVVLGIGADEAECSAPSLWGGLTGFSPKHPPGDHIWVEDHVLTQTVADPLYGFYQKNSATTRGVHSMTRNNSGLDQATFTEIQAGLKVTMAHLVGLVEQAGAKPIILVEECGEQAGLFQKDISDTQRQEGHAKFVDYRTSWLPDNIDIADPYEQMAEMEDYRPTHWQSTGLWNLQGHHIAADVLAKLIERLEKELLENPDT